MIALAANTARLMQEAVEKPQLISPQEGPPSPVFRWYGRVKARIVAIECDTISIQDSSTVVVYTIFPMAQADSRDWEALQRCAEAQADPLCQPTGH